MALSDKRTLGTTLKGEGNVIVIVSDLAPVSQCKVWEHLVFFFKYKIINILNPYNHS